MKAREIADKFIKENPALSSQDHLNASLKDMMNQFIEDLNRMMAQRRIERSTSCIPVLRELNQKWNAVRTRLYKYYGSQVIVQDGFLKMIEHDIPEVYEFYINHTRKGKK